MKAKQDFINRLSESGSYLVYMYRPFSNSAQMEDSVLICTLPCFQQAFKTVYFDF